MMAEPQSVAQKFSHSLGECIGKFLKNTQFAPSFGDVILHQQVGPKFESTKFLHLTEGNPGHGVAADPGVILHIDMPLIVCLPTEPALPVTAHMPLRPEEPEEDNGKKFTNQLSAHIVRALTGPAIIIMIVVIKAFFMFSPFFVIWQSLIFISQTPSFHHLRQNCTRCKRLEGW